MNAATHTYIHTHTYTRTHTHTHAHTHKVKRPLSGHAYPALGHLCVIQEL